MQEETLVITPEQQRVLQIEAMANAELHKIVTELNIVIIPQVTLRMPLDSDSFISLVARERAESQSNNLTVDADRRERLANERVQELCNKFECTLISQATITSIGIDVKPLIIHVSRIEHKKRSEARNMKAQIDTLA